MPGNLVLEGMHLPSTASSSGCAHSGGAAVSRTGCCLARALRPRWAPDLQMEGRERGLLGQGYGFRGRLPRPLTSGRAASWIGKEDQRAHVWGQGQRGRDDPLVGPQRGSGLPLVEGHWRLKSCATTGWVPLYLSHLLTLQNSKGLPLPLPPPRSSQDGGHTSSSASPSLPPLHPLQTKRTWECQRWKSPFDS